MRLTCPSCGAVASAESWQNDGAARDMLQVMVNLPSPLGPSALKYLALFRPGKSAMSWAKALRIGKELAAMVGKGHVVVNGEAARPCPPRIWAAAIERMLEQRDVLRLPMKDHKYLIKIAWTLADKEDARTEQEQQATGRPVRPLAVVEPDDGLLPVERAIRAKAAHLKQMQGGE